MKQIKKLFITVIIVLTSIAINGCDPFDDIYLTLALETEFSTSWSWYQIFLYQVVYVCLILTIIMITMIILKRSDMLHLHTLQ